MLNFFATQEKQAPNYNLEKSKEVWNLAQTKIDKGMISDQNLPRDKETKASCAGIQSDLSKTVNLPKYEGPGQVSSIMKVRRHTHNDQDQVIRCQTHNDQDQVIRCQNHLAGAGNKAE